MRPVGLAVHADWSSDPKKRWMTCALPCGSGWRVSAAEKVADLADWTQRLRARANGDGVALGVDLPLESGRNPSLSFVRSSFAVMSPQLVAGTGFEPVYSGNEPDDRPGWSIPRRKCTTTTSASARPSRS